MSDHHDAPLAKAALCMAAATRGGDVAGVIDTSMVLFLERFAVAEPGRYGVCWLPVGWTGSHPWFGSASVS